MHEEHRSVESHRQNFGDAPLLSGFLFLLVASSAIGQMTSLPSVEQALQTNVQPAEVSQYEMKQFEMTRIPPLPKASTAKEWRMLVGSLRQHILHDIAYHG
jgi:hypothetical protein